MIMKLITFFVDFFSKKKSELNRPEFHQSSMFFLFLSIHVLNDMWRMENSVENMTMLVLNDAMMHSSYRSKWWWWWLELLILFQMKFKKKQKKNSIQTFSFLEILFFWLNDSNTSWADCIKEKQKPVSNDYFYISCHLFVYLESNSIPVINKIFDFHKNQRFFAKIKTKKI